MTMVSLADACRGLGIDAKTLHRWLEDAQLPLLTHPHDARKKGVSAPHLALLASRHHRRLLPLGEPEPSAVPAEPLPLPAALLALPATLSALQAQMEALQQQVTALTRLLPPPEPAPAIPQAGSVPRRTRTPAPTPASRSRPPATPPRKPPRVIARVEYAQQGRYVVICPKHGVLPLEPETPEWFAWVARQESFRFVGREGHFTAHHEWRTPNGAWRAHRHIRNHSYTLRLAPSEHLTLAVLEHAAAALHAHLA